MKHDGFSMLAEGKEIGFLNCESILKQLDDIKPPKDIMG
jgi:hypothetical protein